MAELWGNFISNPFGLIPLALSFFAAYGFLTYVQGFFGSIKHTMTLHGHKEHTKHAQEHAVQGVLIMLTAFIIWEVYRFIASAMGII